MKPEGIHAIVKIITLIGLTTTAVGGFGAYYYGNISSNGNDKAHIDNVEEVNRTVLNRLLQAQNDGMKRFVMGGNSAASFEYTIWRANVVSLNLSNKSKYPVFDLQGFWIDLDDPIAKTIPGGWTKHFFKTADLCPNCTAPDAITFDMSKKEILRANLYYSYENGSNTQEFIIIKEETGIKVAYTTFTSDGRQYIIDQEFPGYDKSHPESIFNYPK